MLKKLGFHKIYEVFIQVMLIYKDKEKDME